MFYLSDAFDDAVRNTHTACAKVEVWSGRTLLLTTESSEILSLISGSVSVNRNAESRRSTKLELLCTSLDAYRSYLDPLLGYDVVPSRGIVYENGDKEWCPLGVFKIDSADTVARGSAYTISITGYDRARMIARNPWTTPYTIASGTEYTAAMQTIIGNRATGFTPEYNMTSQANTTPALHYTERDNPWQQVIKLAEGIGYEAYFDNVGAATAMPIVNPATAPIVLDLTAGTTAVRIGNLQRTVSISDSYNGVIVRGSAPWLLFPVYGEAWDDDPSSPTWRGGSFGSRGKVIADAVVTSNAMASAAASSELYKLLGRTEQINFNILPDPRLDVGDVVRIYDSELATFGRYVVESLSIPLVGGSITGSVRLYTRSVTA